MQEPLPLSYLLTLLLFGGRWLSLGDARSLPRDEDEDEDDTRRGLAGADGEVVLVSGTGG